MSDQLENVMQAADRLRRLESGTHWQDVYETTHYVSYQAMYDRDKVVLAVFALSILPKGKRPVACRCDPGSVRFTRGGQRVETRQTGETIGWNSLPPEVYESQEAADLAMHWYRLDDLIEWACE